MFTDPGAILQAAAILAAPQHTLNSAAARGMQRYTDSSIDVLINILREMEAKKLIPAGLAPPVE